MSAWLATGAFVLIAISAMYGAVEFGKRRGRIVNGTYRAKPNLVAAARWDGDLEPMIERFPQCTMSTTQGGSLLVTYNDRAIFVPKGHFFVFGSGGQMSVLRYDEFEMDYEVVSGTELEGETA